MKKKLTKLCYLASPYSHPSPEIMQDRERIIDAVMAECYRKYKVAIIPPILVSRVIKDILGDEIGSSFKEWEKVDLTYISACDELWVVTMEGWKKSIGVQAEIKFAKKKAIPVRYVNPLTIEFFDIGE